MDSIHLVDPELRTLAEMMRQMTFSPEQVAARKQMFSGGLASVRVKDDLLIEEDERFIAGPSGAPDVRVVIHRPTKHATPMPAFLHIHGGGLVIGAPEMNYLVNRQTAVDIGCVIVSVDYRLAPETPFSGAVEDCYAALRWLHTSAEALGIDRSRVAVGGESAGGGVAAALCLLARDRGEFAIAAQHLNAPMLDDTSSDLTDPHPFTGEFVWTREHNRFGWTAALGGDDISRALVPMRVKNLADLPPAYISVGALDLFFEEDAEYARRLTRAGVPVELHVYPGAFHGFEMANDATITKRSQRDSVEALRRVLKD